MVGDHSDIGDDDSGGDGDDDGFGGDGDDGVGDEKNDQDVEFSGEASWYSSASVYKGQGEPPVHQNCNRPKFIPLTNKTFNIMHIYIHGYNLVCRKYKSKFVWFFCVKKIDQLRCLW